MFVLHLLDDDTASIGVAEPGTGRAYDLYLRRVIALNDDDTVAFMDPEAGVYFAPIVRAEAGAGALAANPLTAPIPLSRRRKLQSEFTSGYPALARAHALRWREKPAGPKIVLAAGVFALASVRVEIDVTLRLMELLTPHLVAGNLPSRQALVAMCAPREEGGTGAGLQESRPDWFLSFANFVPQIRSRMRAGLRDDDLRRVLSVETRMPLGMSVAKLSFTLALLGNNCGCLDARVLQWAYGDERDEVQSHLSKKTRAGTVSPARYADYVRIERNILTRTPYYDPEDPVGLARAQWMLWEQMGESGPEQHDHKEFFDVASRAR